MFLLSSGSLVRGLGPVTQTRRKKMKWTHYGHQLRAFSMAAKLLTDSPDAMTIVCNSF